MSVNLPDIGLVVFDIDDTLCLERDFVIGGFDAVADDLARTYGGRADDLAYKMHELQRSGRRDLFQAILTELAGEADEEEVERLVHLYRTADRTLPLLPDADRALARARNLGLKSAILTDGPLAGQQAKVRLLDLEKRVDHIVYTAGLGQDFAKPGTKGFAFLADYFNVSGSQSVYIGDNEKKDFIGPNQLGWETVKIQRRNALYAELHVNHPLYAPKFTVFTLDELRFGATDTDETNARTAAVREQLINAMKAVFGTDQRRIDHALAVLSHAEAIQSVEGGCPVVVTAAAILHDIGIQEAERKHGSAGGRYQEIEGPPIADRIMHKFGLDPSTIDHVNRIIASHHSAKDIDTREFRIVWDADWLVNIPDELAGADTQKLRQVIEKVFRTPTGKQRACKMFIEA